MRSQWPSHLMYVSGSYARGLLLATLLLVPSVLVNCQFEEYCHYYDSTCNPGASILYALPLAASSQLAVTTPLVERYFVYTNVTSGLDAFSLDINTGALSRLAGAPLASPVSLSVQPDATGRFLTGNIFAAAPNNIRSFTIDARTGTLAQTPVPTVSANNSPVYMEYSTDSRFLYVSNYNSLDISVFSIDQTTGNLSKITDFNTTCGCANIGQLRVTPDGKYMYVVGNGGTETITEVSINATTGALSFIGTVATVAGVDALLVDPGSAFVYAVVNGGTILGYSINTTTGALTALPGSPFAGTAGNLRAAMHPTGKYLYTVNVGGAQLARHDIASNGALSAPSPISFGTNLQYVSIDPTGKFGFVNDGVLTSFHVFSIDQTTGAPAVLAASPISVSSLPGAIAIARTRSSD